MRLNLTWSAVFSLDEHDAEDLKHAHKLTRRLKRAKDRIGGKVEGDIHDYADMVKCFEQLADAVCRARASRHGDDA